MNKIRLIGIRGDQNYEAWRPLVRKVVDRLKLKDQFEEVNNVDAMLGFGLEAVPALTWGKKILLEQNSHIPDEEEIAFSIVTYLDEINFKS